MLDGVPQGPFDYVELVTMLESGQLTVHDLVSKTTESSWKTIKEHPDFREFSITNLDQSEELGSKTESEFDFNFGLKLGWVVLVKKPPHRGGGFRQQGPVSSEELVAMVKKGEVAYSDYAWRKGFSKWERLASLDIFNIEASKRFTDQEEDLPEIPEQPSQDELLQNVERQQSGTGRSIYKKPLEAEGDDLVESSFTLTEGPPPITKTNMNLPDLNNAPPEVPVEFPDTSKMNLLSTDEDRTAFSQSNFDSDELTPTPTPTPTVQEKSYDFKNEFRVQRESEDEEKNYDSELDDDVSYYDAEDLLKGDGDTILQLSSSREEPPQIGGVEEDEESGFTDEEGSIIRRLPDDFYEKQKQFDKMDESRIDFESPPHVVTPVTKVGKKFGVKYELKPVRVERNEQDFESWRDEETFLRKVQKKKRQKTILSGARYLGFGGLIFALVYFGIFIYRQKMRIPSYEVEESEVEVSSPQPVSPKKIPAPIAPAEPVAPKVQAVESPGSGNQLAKTEPAPEPVKTVSSPPKKPAEIVDPLKPASFMKIVAVNTQASRPHIIVETDAGQKQPLRIRINAEGGDVIGRKSFDKYWLVFPSQSGEHYVDLRNLPQGSLSTEFSIKGVDKQYKDIVLGGTNIKTLLYESRKAFTAEFYAEKVRAYQIAKKLKDYFIDCDRLFSQNRNSKARWLKSYRNWRRNLEGLPIPAGGADTFKPNFWRESRTLRQKLLEQGQVFDQAITSKGAVRYILKKTDLEGLVKQASTLSIWQN